mgnify:CR=1 FL=1
MRLRLPRWALPELTCRLPSSCVGLCCQLRQALVQRGDLQAVIQQALAACDGNVSAAARKLGMHRRSLQRKLAKRPVAERPRG